MMICCRGFLLVLKMILKMGLCRVKMILSFCKICYLKLNSCCTIKCCFRMVLMLDSHCLRFHLKLALLFFFFIEFIFNLFLIFFFNKIKIFLNLFYLYFINIINIIINIIIIIIIIIIIY